MPLLKGKTRKKKGIRLALAEMCINLLGRSVDGYSSAVIFASAPLQINIDEFLDVTGGGSVLARRKAAYVGRTKLLYKPRMQQ